MVRQAKNRMSASPSVTAEVRAGGNQAKTTVKPVVNAIQILRLLSENGEPARSIEISRALSINASTCFNILRTLASEGLVTFDRSSKAYQIGVGMEKLAERSFNERQRMEVARPLIHDLAERFGVTATLWRRTGFDHIVLLSVEYSLSGIRVHMPTGARLPLLLGSTGRLFAVHGGLTKAEVKAGFKSLRWVRDISFKEYWEQAQEAKERGWALDDAYFSQGITSIAVPIFNKNGSLAFSLVSVMFKGQFDCVGISELANALVGQSEPLQNILC